MFDFKNHELAPGVEYEGATYELKPCHDTSGAVVDGLFDFGDIARQPIICDVAIALAYLILGKDDPLAVCTTFLKSYMAQRPLRAEELAVLFDLIQTRLAVSIAISSHRALTEKDDPYIIVSQKPAIRALKQLAGLSSDEVERCIRQIAA